MPFNQSSGRTDAVVILNLALSRSLQDHQLSAIPLIMTVDWIITRARWA
jgi:hypothetical protein